MKFIPTNREAPDWMPPLTASHLCLFCLSMSHKKDVRLKWVKLQVFPAAKIDYCKMIKCDVFLLLLKTTIADTCHVDATLTSTCY